MSVPRLARAIGAGPDGWGLRKAKVTAFVISADPTVGSTVTVLLDGEGDPIEGVGYLSTYAPTTNDWVWLLVTPGLWLALGKQA